MASFSLQNLTVSFCLAPNLNLIPDKLCSFHVSEYFHKLLSIQVRYAGMKTYGEQYLSNELLTFFTVINKLAMIDN